MQYFTLDAPILLDTRSLYILYQFRVTNDIYQMALNVVVQEIGLINETVSFQNFWDLFIHVFAYENLTYLNIWKPNFNFYIFKT